MEKIYKKKLTPTEAKRRYVYIESDAISKVFPPIGKPFKLRIDRKEFKVKIDDYFRIFGSVFEDYIDFIEGNVFVFKKNTDGSFNVSIEE